jgi:sporulation protein YunB
MIIIFIIFFLLLYKVDRDIKPLLFSVTNAEVRIITTESINKTVKDELSKNVKYSDFVSIKTDRNGDISAIELNTVEMNKFGNNIALRIQEEMKFIGGTGVSVPLGVLTGSSILAYYGPRMKIKVSPVGNITTDFKSELQSAGINQTRYRVYICVNTTLQVMIPLGKEKVDITSTIPIAETLIVGKVPASYFNTTPGDANVPNVVPIPTPGEK